MDKLGSKLASMKCEHYCIHITVIANMHLFPRISPLHIYDTGRCNFDASTFALYTPGSQVIIVSQPSSLRERNQIV